MCCNKTQQQQARACRHCPSSQLVSVTSGGFVRLVRVSACRPVVGHRSVRTATSKCGSLDEIRGAAAVSARSYTDASQFTDAVSLTAMRQSGALFIDKQRGCRTAYQTLRVTIKTMVEQQLQ